MLDSDLRVIYANSSFFADFQVSRDETERKFFYRIANERWNIPKLRALLEKVAADDAPVNDFEVAHDFPGLGSRTMLLNARPIKDAHGDEPLILLAIEDITDRKEGEAALRKLAAIVQSSDDAIISADLQRVITSWNGGAQRTFGYTETEAVGEPISIIVPPELRQEEEQIRRRLAAGEHIEHYDTVRVTKQGKRIDVSLTISPITDSAGQVVGSSKITRDITDRKQLDQIRQQRHLELESLVEQRTASLRQLSSHLHRVQDDERRKIARDLHDSVGQYLASVKMNIAQVDQPALQARAKAALSESDELLDKCLAEIRTISHLLHPPLLDESGLASAATWYVEGFGKRSSIQTNLDISPHLKRLPQAVEMAMFRALQESLTNVHRHSGSPKVDVRIELANGQVDMLVRDYGRGIAPERLEKFHTAGSDLGVGLTGMRERVTELGGNLQLLSESPGISVRITIPLAQDQTKAAGSAEHSGEKGSAA